MDLDHHAAADDEFAGRRLRAVREADGLDDRAARAVAVAHLEVTGPNRLGIPDLGRLPGACGHLGDRRLRWQPVSVDLSLESTSSIDQPSTRRLRLLGSPIPGG